MPTVPTYPSGQPAAQTLLRVADPASCPFNFITLANVITGPKLPAKNREVETTAHPIVQNDSATIPATYIPVITEAGIMTFDISVKTKTPQYDMIISLAKRAAFASWQIVEQDDDGTGPTVIAFDGFFTQWDLDHPVNGMVKMTCGVRVSGDVEYRA